MDDLQVIAPGELLDAALQVLLDVLIKGDVPPSLPDGLNDHARFQEVLSYLTDLQQFALSISKGDLSPSLKRKGIMAGSLKNLQANLRHLAWQTQMIAQGDFSQRVDFMGDFSTAFNSMVTRLEEARNALQLRNQELDAFAHTAAHDLQNPIAHIILYAELLKDDQTSVTDAERIEWATAIARIGYKMDNIIQELLLLSQVRQTNVETQPLDMAAIVDEARQRMALTIADFQAEVTQPAAWPVALGHGPWIEEVWVNYIGNAIYYGGRPPRVELGAETLPDGMVRFWTRDNGQGLAPEAQARLFTPFTRLDQVRVKGHGLGLSIVRRIVEKLGGQVGVASEVGRGSTFFFTLPASDQPAA